LSIIEGNPKKSAVSHVFSIAPQKSPWFWSSQNVIRTCYCYWSSHFMLFHRGPRYVPIAATSSQRDLIHSCYPSFGNVQTSEASSAMDLTFYHQRCHFKPSMLWDNILGCFPSNTNSSTYCHWLVRRWQFEYM